MKKKIILEENRILIIININRPVDTWAAGLACRPAGGACWGLVQAVLKSCSAYCMAGSPCKPSR